MVNSTLHINNISLWYEDQHVVNGVSFNLEAGRILALIGPNGAGKSSVMRVMAGLVKPEKGSVFYNGQQLSNFQKINTFAGFFIESPSFYKYLSAKQNLNILQQIRGGSKPTADLLKLVGLSDAANKKVGKYSKGMKQRLGIAQTLIADPEILVLDEPFDGLDMEVKLFLMDIIRKLAKEQNKAILISSHLLPDMEVLADDFVLLDKGKVHLAGSLDKFRHHEQKVTFCFEKEIPGTILPQIPVVNCVEGKPCCWEANLSVHETPGVLQFFITQGIAPYSVVRENLLHAKYMEIAE